MQREWERLVGNGCELIAPILLLYEVSNVLHQQQRAQIITAETAHEGLRRVLELPIELHGDTRLHDRAFELAVKYCLLATYDAYYLALAERFRVPLWTCDRRLAEAVPKDFPTVHLVL